MRATTERQRTPGRVLLAVCATALIATGCSYLELAGRNVGTSLGLVEPPPQHRTGGDPVPTPVPVTGQSAKR